MAGVKKVVKRRRRRRGKKRMYFGTDTHDSIVKYQSEQCEKVRENIYVKEILPSFEKLVENLIFIHGFVKPNAPYEEIKNDCVTFLYETLYKFDASRGSKAFSYFNVVAKNWLIINSKKNTKQMKRNVSMEDSDCLSPRDQIAIDEYNQPVNADIAIMKKESMQDMFQLMSEIKDKLNSENELACMSAIIKLFEHIDDLDMLNKRAVFVYMRDISGLNPKQLSIAMSTIRKHYKQLKKSNKYDIFF